MIDLSCQNTISNLLKFKFYYYEKIIIKYIINVWFGRF